MIVVLGDLAGSAGRVATASSVAIRAAGQGGRVEVVGVVADDPDGDRLILALAAARVGHAAVLRGPARSLEAEDVDLALRYLPEIRVIVVVDAPSAAARAASDGAGWSGASLIVVRSAAAIVPDADEAAAADAAIVLEAPASDPDGTFAGFVGAFATKLDGGATPADAWTATTRELAVDPA